jgi:hypothetical protein
MQQLYGMWQTEDWEPPPAVDGKVPRNEHGNVEVPPFTKSLPKGELVAAMWPACRCMASDSSAAVYLANQWQPLPRDYRCASESALWLAKGWRLTLLDAVTNRSRLTGTHAARHMPHLVGDCK